MRTSTPGNHIINVVEIVGEVIKKAATLLRVTA